MRGPAVVPLENFAEMKVLPQLVFYDRDSAREFLAQAGVSTPQILLGMLVPETRGWRAILEYKAKGHIEDSNMAGFKPEEMMKKISENVEKQNASLPPGVSRISAAKWELEPIYLPESRMLEWALRITSDSGTVINHYICLLARDGVLMVTTITPESMRLSFEGVAELTRCIKFKEGHQYADFGPGDTTGTDTLADLVGADYSGSRVAATAQPAVISSDLSQRGLDAFWVGLGVVTLLGCFVAVGGTLAYRKLRARHSTAAAEPQPTVAATPANGSEAPVIPAPGAAPVRTRRTLLSEHRARPVPTETKTRHAVETNGSRRRSFDYNRYFSDLLSTVYSQSYAADHAGGDGLAFDSSRVSLVPGNQNGSHNGANGENANPAVHQELILSQQSLIEEQRRLIQEQSKIIEEKTRLIAEKNNILKLQSQLMEHKLL